MTQRHKNRLRWYREQIGYTQLFVAKLLGHKSNTCVSNYEEGKSTPDLSTGLQLEIILCTPLSNLFPDQYQAFKQKINPLREKYKRLGVSRQTPPS